MKLNEKKMLRRYPPKRIGRMVETIVGCKWSLTVIDLIQRGIHRPGKMERMIEGLTAKVLNDCLRLLVSYGILIKQSFPDVPPRVEYHFTKFGKNFILLFEYLEVLDAQIESKSLRKG